MLRKIRQINQMAVYRDFSWDRSIRKPDGSVGEFEAVNVIYGRNYSGKTTLSRLVRSLETGYLSEKYGTPRFSVEFKDGSIASTDNLTGHGHTIRVFNEDFVRENLAFVVDPQQHVSPFAILGEDNNKIEAAIREKEQALGDKENKTGLLGELLIRSKAVKDAQSAHKASSDKLRKLLVEKANSQSGGIKYNKLYGVPTYNVQKLQSDINRILITGGDLALGDNEAEEMRALLKEDAKPPIPSVLKPMLRFDQLAIQVEKAVTKRIAVAEPLQELLDDALLQEWVRIGRGHHEGKRSACGFCGSPLPLDLWGRLDRHFNQESEELRRTLCFLLKEVDAERKRVCEEPRLEPSAFYASFRDELVRATDRLKEVLRSYDSALELLENRLNARLNDVFTPLAAASYNNPSEAITQAYDEVRRVTELSDEFTKSLTRKQKEARDLLRISEVSEFVGTIQYVDSCREIERLLEKVGEAQTSADAIQDEVASLRTQISALRAQLRDESKGADRVNHYLTNYFGHDTLRLEPEETDVGVRFQVVRDGRKAHHLSEGECSLIAFCYFVAKLDDIETKGRKPIIWIDDPISSLDANHIFYVFSMISTCIVGKGDFGQLIVSTHNIEFLKYLKRLAGKSPDGKSYNRSYFIVERSLSGSSLRPMPAYLKKYVTEFNYLFHQIYRCATADPGDDSANEVFYSYGNNARKFLEAYLFYKYPSHKESDEDKVARFFGDDISPVLLGRIHNEYSHLEGSLEKGVSPVDVPEMKKSALLILAKIKETDEAQFKALLQSIGATDPFVGQPSVASHV